MAWYGVCTLTGKSCGFLPRHAEAAIRHERSEVHSLRLAASGIFSASAGDDYASSAGARATPCGLWRAGGTLRHHRHGLAMNAAPGAGSTVHTRCRSGVGCSLYPASGYDASGRCRERLRG